MRRILQLISWLSLAATIGPALLYSCDKMSLDTVQTCMFVSTITWFVATSLWMGREDKSQPKEAPSAVL